MNTNQNFKIILCGSAGCGKTTLRKLATKRYFEKKYILTLGVEVAEFTFQNRTIALWDCAENPLHTSKSMGEEYWKDANAAIVVFDVNDTNSRNTAIERYIRLRKVFGNSFKIVIVGNKIDLLHDNSKIENIPDTINLFTSFKDETIYDSDKIFTSILK